MNWKKVFVVSVLILGSVLAKAENFETIESDQEDETPVTHEKIEGDFNLTQPRPWRAPDYSQQDQAMGWSEHAFDVPKGMNKAYQFWIDIYSKYNSDQGVLHDAEIIDLIYSKIDFSDISSQADLTGVQKEVLKIRRVKAEKRRIIEILKKLNKAKGPEGLNPEELNIWNAFAADTDKHKFIDATKKNRLRFQLGQKDRLVQGIFFSGRYLEEFEKIFREAGLPMELTRLAFVESSFNVLARSKVGASGLWQLMRYTARPYMMMNNAIDKRNHPFEAARVAAKLLRNNFKMLESWPLAVTGWNHGPSGILKLTRKYQTRELGDLIDNVTMKKRFGFASRNFYASFLAVLEVEKNAPTYLGNIIWSQPLESAEIKVLKPLKYATLLEWFDGNDEKTQIFNPQINKPVRMGKLAIPKGALISVPKDKVDIVEAYIKEH